MKESEIPPPQKIAFDKLLSQYFFEIPEYQRGYAWEDEQLEDLWEDLLRLIGEKQRKSHYFGTMIFRITEDEVEVGRGVENPKLKVIDGQQRLVSIIILLDEVISYLEKEGNYDLEEAKKRFLKHGDRYKIALLEEEDKKFFKRFILSSNTERESREPSSFDNPTQENLWNAKNTFEEWIKDREKEEALDLCDSLLDAIGDLQLMFYPTLSKSEAVLIFETVNDRGKDLTDLEKTKSFLMHMIYLSVPEEDEDDYIDDIRYDFSDIYEYLQVFEDELDLDEDRIQRYHYIIFGNWRIKDHWPNYLKRIKEKVRRLVAEDKEKCRDFIMEYTEDLKKSFKAIRDIAEYKDENNETGKLLKRLFLLGNMGNIYPLLIALWRKFKDDKQKLKKVLETLEILVFRLYSIGSGRSDTKERFLAKRARNTHPKGYLDGSIPDEGIEAEEIVGKIRSMLRNSNKASDSDFRRRLELPKFYKTVSNKIIRYLFCFYEESIRVKDDSLGHNKIVDIVQNEKEEGQSHRPFDIEHIWPKNPEEDLPVGIDSEEKYEDEYKHSLGNISLAPKRPDSSWQNTLPERKKDGYLDTSFKVLHRVVQAESREGWAAAEEWSDEKIENRREKIVKFALDNWSLD